MDRLNEMMSERLGFIERIVRFGGPAISAYIIEFIGVLFLVMSIGFNSTIGNGNTAPLAIGVTLMVMIFMGGHISGAHFNPAVTMGVRLAGRDHIETLPALMYMLVQLAGGFCAALIVWGITGETFAPTPGYKANGEMYNLGVAFVCEILWTFALVLVMLNCATTKSQSSNSFFGLAIGFTVVSGAYAVGPISGGAFNPAVALGPLVVHSAVQKVDYFKYIWIYWVGEFCGSLLASIVFRVTNTMEYRKHTVLSPTSPEGAKRLTRFSTYAAEDADEV